MTDNPEEDRVASKDPEIRTALILGLLGFVVMGFGAFFVGVYPSMVKRSEQARRAQLKENLKQIGIALHNYQQAQSSQPKPEAASDDKISE